MSGRPVPAAPSSDSSISTGTGDPPAASFRPPLASRASVVLWLLSLAVLAKVCTPLFIGSYAALVVFMLSLLDLTGTKYECHWGIPEPYLHFIRSSSQ